MRTIIMIIIMTMANNDHACKMLMQIMMGGERLAAWEQVVVVAINYRVREKPLLVGETWCKII